MKYIYGLILVGLVAGLFFFKMYYKKEVVLQNTEAPTLKVINVLSKEFYDDAHIKGSINIDYADLSTKAQAWDKKTPIVLYCANYACLASSEGARELSKQGFMHAMAYEGGTAEWYELGKSDPSYVTEGPAQQSYLTASSKKPVQEHGDVHVVTASELKTMMHEARLL